MSQAERVGNTQKELPECLKANTLTANRIERAIWRPANRENQHFIGAIVGGEGSGKSGTALAMCEAVDPTFTIDRVVFEAEQLIRLINKDLAPGTAIIIDEAGVVLGNRTWHDAAQITLNQTLQTLRDDNLVVFMTVPVLGELDSQARNRLTNYLEMQHLKEGDYAAFTFQDYHPKRDDGSTVYKPHPRMRVNGVTRKVRRFKMKPPSQELWEAYTEKKAEFKDEQYGKTLDKFTDDDEGETTPADLSDADLAEYIKQERGIEPFIGEDGRNGEPVLSWRLIKGKLDIGRPKAKTVKELLSSDPEVTIQ